MSGHSGLCVNCVKFKKPRQHICMCIYKCTCTLKLEQAIGLLSGGCNPSHLYMHGMQMEAAQANEQIVPRCLGPVWLVVWCGMVSTSDVTSINDYNDCAELPPQM